MGSTQLGDSCHHFQVFGICMWTDQVSCTMEWHDAAALDSLAARRGEAQPTNSLDLVEAVLVTHCQLNRYSGKHDGMAILPLGGPCGQFFAPKRCPVWVCARSPGKEGLMKICT